MRVYKVADNWLQMPWGKMFDLIYINISILIIIIIIITINAKKVEEIQ